MSDTTFKAKANKVWGSIASWYKIRRAILHLRRTKTRDFLKKILKSKDMKALTSAIFTIVMDGLFISGLLYYFIGFHWQLMFALGAGWWFLKKDLLTELRRLLSSINIVKIGK